MEHQLQLALAGPFRPQQLEQAVAAVVERHEMLRASFVQVPGLLYPLQVINEAHSGALWCKAATLPVNHDEIRITHPCDWSRTCMLDVMVVNTNAEESLLVLRLPALCTDGDALMNIAAEISALYHADSSLQELPPSFMQFAAWHREMLQADDAIAAIPYPGPSALPFHTLPLQEAIPEWQNHSRLLTPELNRQLANVADRHGLPVRSFFLAAWKLWLSQYQHAGVRMDIGILISGRSADVFRHISGPLGIILPVYGEADHSSSMQQLWEEVETAIAQLEEEAYYTGNLPQGNDDSFTIGFEYYNAGECNVNRLFTAYEKYALKLQCLERQGQWQVQLSCDKQLFTTQEITFMQESFMAFIANAAVQLQAPANTLLQASATEEYFLLNEFNGKTVSWPATNVVNCFEARAARWPERPALSDDKATLSYRELNEQVNQLAHWLIQQHGIQPGNIVAVRMERSPMLITALLAVIKTGAAFLPVDVTTPAERLEFMLKDSEAVLLVTDSVLPLSIPVPQCALSQQEWALYSTADLKVQTAADPLFYVIYTSGSTGVPKGVKIHQQSFLNYINWFVNAHDITENDSTALFSSVAFDLCYTALWSALLTGARLYLYQPQVYMDSDRLLHDILAQQVTYIKLTPTHLHMLCLAMEHLQAPAAPALRLVVCGGEAIQPADLEKCYRLNGQMVLVNHYGPTETTIGAIAHKILPDGFSRFRACPVIGKPVWNNRVYILDGSNRLLPVGVAGEICIAGSGVAAGYLNRDTLTAEKFIQLPFDKDRLYKTGDLGKWTADGNIIFLGRKDEQVKIRGYRVELAEISHCLRGFEPVTDAAVVMQDISGTPAPVAYYTAAAPVGEAQLKAYLESRLPEYMLPAAYVQLPALLVTPNGKLDKKALPPAGQLIPTQTTGYAAPATPVEAQLATIWADLLQRERMDVNESFFAAGGHSLKAVQLISRIREAFRVKISLRDLFDHPSIRSLAERIAVSEEAALEHIIPLAPAAGYDLSHAQKGIWILDQLGDGMFAFNMPAVFSIKGPLQVQHLQEAFTRLVQRHEILRTTFTNANGYPQQQVHDAAATDTRIIFNDIRKSGDKEERIRQLTAQTVGFLFDLEQGPLVCTRLIQEADEHFVFIINLHHIIADAWSFEIIMQELSLFYESCATGVPPALQPLHIHYKDYAAWANRQLAGERLALHQQFWINQFSDGIPVLDLPLDFPRPAARSYAGHAVGFKFEQAEAAALREMTATYDVTLYMLFMALVNMQLYLHTGNEDIVIGSPVSGRTAKELEAQIGMYLNNLPVRTAFRANAPFTTLLRQVKKSCMSAFEHQAYPFDLIVADLKCRRQPGRSPLFDVVLVMTTRNVTAGTPVLHNMGLQRMDAAVPNGSTTDLRFYFREEGEQLSCGIEYNTDLFATDTMHRFLGAFRQTIGVVLEDHEVLPASLRMANSTIF